MKIRFKLCGSLFLLTTLCAEAQVTLQNFSNVLDGNTFFTGSWEATGDTIGTANPNSQFSQGAGVYNIASSTATNSADSSIVFFNSPLLSIGTNTQISVTAKLLSGNTATSFTVFLSNTNPSLSASVSFPTSLFNSGGYATATLSFFQTGGFNPNAIETVKITGNQIGGSSAFDISFDNISAVPEPSTYAAILGTATLGLAYLRRRNRSQPITAASR
jgi:hypothetical protein